MTAIGTAGAGRDPITEAEMRVAQMQEQQLAAAEANPVAKLALGEARTRAVLRIAARLNATVDQLHQLGLVMADVWSIERERARALVDAVHTWAVDNSDGDSDDEWAVMSIAWLVVDLWPDVVLECDGWARRALT